LYLIPEFGNDSPADHSHRGGKSRSFRVESDRLVLLDRRQRWGPPSLSIGDPRRESYLRKRWVGLAFGNRVQLCVLTSTADPGIQHQASCPRTNVGISRQKSNSNAKRSSVREPLSCQESRSRGGCRRGKRVRRCRRLTIGSSTAERRRAKSSKREHAVR
jgi:hypothetical protein